MVGKVSRAEKSVTQAIVSRAHKALLLPATQAVNNAFAGFGALFPIDNLPYLLLPHDLRNTLMARHLGFSVPSPMMHYDYESLEDKPFLVQTRSCELMVENPRSYNLNDKGTGKTATALWAWKFLKQSGHVNKMLVVAPRSTLWFTWAAEVLKRLPGVKVSVLYGKKHATKADRLKALAEDADIYVINHDGFRVVREELEKRTDIDVLCLDEVAVYRNNSDRSKQMRAFANIAGRFKYVWGMTGSPMPQEPTDVWGQAKIVTPNTVPSRRNACRSMLMQQLSQYVWRPKPNAIQDAFNMLQPSVRYALDEVVELPELITRDINVDMTKSQGKVYEAVRKDLVAMVADGTIKAVNQGTALGKLLQVAGGWVYHTREDHSRGFTRLDASLRVAALIDEITSSAHKVLVFVPYRHAIEGLHGIFDRLNADPKTALGFDHCMVHGETQDRDQLLNAFQNTEQYKVMLVHPGCIHHGVTLTSADTAIWYSPILSFDQYDQANARFRRIGQKHKQHLLHLVSTPVERKCYRLLNAKDTLQDKLLDLLEATTAERDAVRGNQ